MWSAFGYENKWVPFHHHSHFTWDPGFLTGSLLRGSFNRSTGSSIWHLRDSESSRDDLRIRSSEIWFNQANESNGGGFEKFTAFKMLSRFKHANQITGCHQKQRDIFMQMLTKSSASIWQISLSTWLVCWTRPFSQVTPFSQEPRIPHPLNWRLWANLPSWKKSGDLPIFKG